MEDELHGMLPLSGNFVVSWPLSEIDGAYQMPLTREQIDLAVRNVARYGDTAVFPFPIENHVFFDRKDEVIAIVEGVDRDFDSALNQDA